MLLALGPHQFDITHRAIVMGVLDRSLEPSSDGFLRDADRLVTARADALAIDGSGHRDRAGVDEPAETERLAAGVMRLRERFDLPIAVRTSVPAVAGACFTAGAVVGHDDSGFDDPAYLRAAAAAGASVVVGAGSVAEAQPVADFLEERAVRAEAAGITAERVVVDAGLDHVTARTPALDRLRDHDRIARLGWPVLLSDPAEQLAGASAAHAVGIVRGARIVRTRDVRSARRVAEVTARLLEARAEPRRLREVS